MADRETKRECKQLAEAELRHRSSPPPQPFPWLPKFWRDTGGWNDTVVSMCSAVLPLATLLVVSFYFQRPLLGFLLMPVGWVGGMIIGFTTIAILCTFFRRDDAVS